MTSYLVVIKAILPSITKSLSNNTLADDSIWCHVSPATCYRVNWSCVLWGARLMPGPTRQSGNVLVTIATVAIVLPLAMLRQIGFLGYTSSMSIVFLALFAMVVIAVSTACLICLVSWCRAQCYCCDASSPQDPIPWLNVAGDLQRDHD